MWFAWFLSQSLSRACKDRHSSGLCRGKTVMMAVLKVSLLLWALVNVVLPINMDNSDDEDLYSGSGSESSSASPTDVESLGKNAADGNVHLDNLCVLCASAALYLLA